MEPSQGADIAFIFDMDGVLVQSLEYLVPSYNIVLERYGYRMEPEDYHQYNGWKLHDIVVALNEKHNLTLDTLEFATEVNAYHRNGIINAQRSYAPEHAFIKELKKRNAKMAVATASRRSRAVDLLNICGYEEFHALVTGEDVQKGKPDPDIFLKAAAAINHPPYLCAVPEDAINGLIAARRAGMVPIGVTSINHAREELEPYADLVVDSIGDLTYDQVHQLFLRRA